MMPSRPTARFLAPLILALGFGAGRAAAQTEVCIESTSALYQAFDAFDGGSTEPVTFKLRSGTYSLSSDLSLWYRTEGDPSANYGKLSLRGGYGPGCATHSTALGATTLVGNGGQRSVDIELNDNELEIAYVSSTDVDWRISNWIPGNPTPGSVVIRHVRWVDAWFSLGTRFHDLLISTALIEARAGTPDDSAISFTGAYLDDSRRPTLAVANSTVRRGGLRLRFLPWDETHSPPFGVVRLSSNVFDNDGAEVDILNADTYLSHNRYDSLSVTGGSIPTHLDNLSAPPQLGSGGVPANGSPVVNAGTRFVPGGLPTLDLAGNPRMIGTDPDMGAFETAVNNALYLDVTNNQPSGAGSLAQAVASANAFDGRQVIRFAIPGACPRVITLDQTLTLTDDTDIDGSTQPGTEFNTLSLGNNGAPCIVLRAGAGVSHGLVFDSDQSADDLSIGHVAFSGFAGDGIRLLSGRGHLLTGLQFGGAVSGTPLLAVGTGIRIAGSALDVQIGGPDAAQSNLIGGATIGILLSGSGGNQVIGNAIGDALLQDVPNGVGVAVYSPYNRIEDNLIALSNGMNLLLSSEDTHHSVVVHNTLITAGAHGLHIAGGANRNRVGPGNHFGGNGQDGIFVASGSWNDLSGNTYGNNGGLAIDLGSNGVTLNDADPLFDAPTTPNRNQNHPVLNDATVAPFGSTFLLTLEGSLSSTRGAYRVEVYRNTSCSASGHGEGVRLLGSATIDLDCAFIGPDDQCTKSFGIGLLGPVQVGHYITATATSAGGHTSEFSACRVVSEPGGNADALFRDGFE